MSDLETDRDTAQELVTEIYGRGAAISEEQQGGAHGGWKFTIWNAKGKEALNVVSRQPHISVAYKTLIRELKGRR